MNNVKCFVVGILATTTTVWLLTTLEVVYTKLSDLNPNNAAGPDNWPLKEMADQLCNPLIGSAMRKIDILQSTT